MDVKLLNLNKDWRQVRPTIKTDDSGSLVTGYQHYKLSKTDIVPMSGNTQIKLDLIKNTVFDDVNNKTVSDIGCSNMFFGFLAKLYGATKVIGVDLDKEYIAQNTNLIKLNNFENVFCKDINAADYKETADVVFAFAIIHWVYSCSGFLGSLENVVKHFRSITNNILYIEWIDPSDNCIADILHHLDFNKNLVTQDFNKDNFLRYLKDNFSLVTFCGNSKETREIYRCVV